MESLSFDEFADFIRTNQLISRKKLITQATCFEADLGITGDDGCELLEATEGRFGVCLHSEEDGYRGTFNLGRDEYLFHSEGINLSLFGNDQLISIFGTQFRGTEPVREFTVGELYEAVRKAMDAKSARSDKPQNKAS